MRHASADGLHQKAQRLAGHGDKTLDPQHVEFVCKSSDARGERRGVGDLAERPRAVVLNKIDVPEARELADLVKPELTARGLAVYEVSAATTEGLRELKFAMAQVVAEARAAQPEPEPTRVVIRPAAVSEPGFEVTRTPDGAYLISGEKPERWVRQTDFTNDEAVGYLADRLARLGVEEALANDARRRPGYQSHFAC